MRECAAVLVFDRFNVRDVKSLGGTSADRLFWLGDFDPEWIGKRAIIDRCLDSVALALTCGKERP